MAPMLGKSGYDHNKSKEITILTIDGESLTFGSVAEMSRVTGYSNTAVSMAIKSYGVPYTFKRGVNKGMTVVDYKFQLKVK